MLFRFLFIVFICVSSMAHSEEVAEELIGTDSKLKDVLVLKAIASDLIILENGQRIKLLGIESFGAPSHSKVEYDRSGKPIESKDVEPTIPLEEQAIVFAQDLMEGKKVRLEYDVESRDEKGMKTAYVYLPGGQMANVEILRQGFVRLKIRPPNVKHQDLLKQAYQEARKEQRGFLSY